MNEGKSLITNTNSDKEIEYKNKGMPTVCGFIFVGGVWRSSESISEDS